MVDINWKPDTRQLRQFGWISLVGFGIIGAAVGYKFGHFENQTWTVPGILWGIAGLSAILAVIWPGGLRPLYWGLMCISAIIGPIVSTVALLLIFLLVFTPLALWFKIIGRDELRRKLDPNAESYWVDAPPTPKPASYFRQF